MHVGGAVDCLLTRVCDIQTLQQTRQVLGESSYKQVPQLSIGFKELDLNQPLRF